MANSNLVVITGSDEGKVAMVAHAAFQKLSEGSDDDFSNEIIDGMADNAEGAVTTIHRVIDSLQTYPFFGTKTIWLKNVNFMARSQTGSAESVIDALEALLEVLKKGLPEPIRLLINAPSIDKTRTFYKNLNKLCQIQNFDAIDTSRAGWEDKVRVLVLQYAKEFSLQFAPDALELFVLLAGEFSTQIRSELEKLDLYLGKDARLVELDLVRTLVPLSREGVIFEIGESLSRRQGTRALRLIDEHLSQGESPVSLIRASLIPTVRNLFYARLLMDEFGVRAGSAENFSSSVKRLPADQSAFLPRTKSGEINAWGIAFAANHAQHFTLQGLRDAMEACLDADRSLVTSQLDKRMVLHRLIGRVLAAAAPPKRRVS